MATVPEPLTTTSAPSTSLSTIKPLVSTLRAPAWAYLHLQLTSSNPQPHPQPRGDDQEIDILTASTHLTAALSQYLGLSGAAVAVDILKVEGREVWVRVPREDLSAVVAALGGWVGSAGGAGAAGGGSLGWRVREKGNWLRALIAEAGEAAAWR
ncbi:MAG: hypothetical protein M1832_005802 [Thelocarpon impressellum]|nr:MAG: hypothetical protein M1832_005802 [Thelocarpon impressellum]